jgi:phage terminase large subunit
MNLNIKTPKWAKPLLKPARYKGAKGGRGGGKSHFLAELLVETLVINPNTSAVCIREIQRSLKFSAKKVIEEKINSLGVEEYFEITNTEIRSTKGKGIIIFQGMQDHTSDSIKSLVFKITATNNQGGRFGIVVFMESKPTYRPCR